MANLDLLSGTNYGVQLSPEVRQYMVLQNPSQPGPAQAAVAPTDDSGALPAESQTGPNRAQVMDWVMKNGPRLGAAWNAYKDIDNAESARIANEFHRAADLIAGGHPAAEESTPPGTYSHAGRAAQEAGQIAQGQQWATEDRPAAIAARNAQTQRLQAQTAEDVAKAGKETADLADVQRSRLALNDADSIESQTYRALAGKYGLVVPDNMSGARVAQLLPGLEKAYEAETRARMAGQRINLLGWTLKTLPTGGQVYVNTHTLETRAVNGDGSPGAQLSPPRVGGGIGGSGAAPIVVQPPGGAQAAPAAEPGAAPPSGGPPPIKAPRRAPAAGGQAPTPGAVPAGAQPFDRLPDAAPDGSPQFVHDPKLAPYQYKQLEERQTKFGKDLDPNSGTGEIAANQKRLNAAIRLRKLVTNEDGSIKTYIPPQFMRETAMALAQLVNSGGQPPEGLVNELTPRTGSSKIADWAQWITNNPKDAGQQGFVKLYLESANREAGAAQQAIDKALQGRVGKNADFVRHNPEDAWRAAASQGYDLDPKTLRLTPKGAGGAAQAGGKTVVERRRAKDGRTLVKYSDGSIGVEGAPNG